MGAEATCRGTFKGKTERGRARLETDAVEFRAETVKLSIRFREITRLSVRADALSLTSPKGTLTLFLGHQASKWLDKIRNPPSRLDKLGVKAGLRTAVLGVDEAAFERELEEAGAVLQRSRAARDLDLIFYGANTQPDLARLATLKTRLQPAGALWIVRPKGRPEISEAAVMAAGKSAGLVDVKVVRFSDTHTAEKFVIPLRARST